jgi:hypothetical protein
VFLILGIKIQKSGDKAALEWELVKSLWCGKLSAFRTLPKLQTGTGKLGTQYNG